MPTRRLSLSALCLALLGLVATLAVSAPSADASSVVLCRGFSACNDKGLSNHGYQDVYRQMWWRMYAGHNCTNYVAYRMVSRGMSATRPWSGSGDARNWGVVFKDKVNQTPMVGSIAWWSSNHVAYVERIIDADTFVISEDHYGGDFDWRRITRSGGGWPTGFIHLNDERVTNVGKPAVLGTPQVDASLSATRGTWSQGGATYSFQWYANGQPIAGATQQTYRPTPGLVGTPVQVRVRAVKSGYLVGQTLSPLTTATAPGEFEDVAAPEIDGIAKVGATLTASDPAFLPAPGATTMTWYADGVAIPGATGKKLVLRAAQLNKVITVSATATRPGYTSSTQTSAPTLKVGPEKIVVDHEPTLQGTPMVGKNLAVRNAQLTPGGLSATYVWMRDGQPVKGRSADTYPLGSLDVGHKISVRVTWTKPGYTPVTRTMTTTRIVRAYPRISVVSRAHRQLTVIVKALGVPVVRGKVLVRTPWGSQRTVTLVNGEATFTAPWIYAGERTYLLDYQGSGLVVPGTATRRILVR